MSDVTKLSDEALVVQFGTEGWATGRCSGYRYEALRAELLRRLAISRALQSTSVETMIPLADAVRVVTDAIDNERKDWADKTLPSAGASIALMNVANAAVAALQALGGGDET